MSNNYGPKIVTNGLVLCLDAADRNSYPGSGNTWFDLSGNGNNGSLINGPTFSSNNGGSIVFDGVNDYGSVLANEQLMTTQFTKSVWFNILNIPVDTNIREVFRQGNLYFLISYRSDLNPKRWEIGFFDSNGQKYWQPSTLPINTWQNITLTGNGSNYGIYYNAILVASGSYVGLNASGTGNIFIGSFASWSRFMNCIVGIIQYYNRGLTSQEIKQNYNATKGRFGL